MLMNLSSAMGLFSDFEAVKSAARPMSQISVFSIDCTTRPAIKRLHHQPTDGHFWFIHADYL